MTNHTQLCLQLLLMILFLPMQILNHPGRKIQSAEIIPADTTDGLQSADISTNNAAKDFLREYWHA